MAGRRTLVIFLMPVSLMAASRSPSGGSAFMEVCKGSRFQAAVSINSDFLRPAFNIAEKFGEAELVRFYQQLALLGPRNNTASFSRDNGTNIFM